jgi:hypothetical protein
VNDFVLTQFNPHQVAILTCCPVAKFFEYRITVFNPEPHLSFIVNLYSAVELAYGVKKFDDKVDFCLS